MTVRHRTFSEQITIAISSLERLHGLTISSAVKKLIKNLVNNASNLRANFLIFLSKVNFFSKHRLKLTNDRICQI